MKVLAVVVAALLVGACASDEGRVTGVVVGVEGDLSRIEAFDIQSGGDRIRFVPEDGLDVFGDAGTPLSHLFEHLQTGDPVRVTYRIEDGVRIALRVEDA